MLSTSKHAFLLYSSCMAVQVSAKDLKRRDFILNGNLWQVIFVISLPLFIFTILSGINDILDNLMSAGISTAAVASSAQLSQVKNMISALGTGLASGGSILIAREIGKKDYQKARSIATSVLTYVLILIAVILLIVLPFSKQILIACGVDASSAELGQNYFRIIMVASCLSMINSVFVGAEKARGATIGITLMNIGTLVIKLILSVILVYVIKINDMTWIGLATLIATGSMTCIVFFRFFFQKGYIFHVSFKEGEYSGKFNRRLANISFPIFLGKFIFSLGKVVVNALADPYGKEVKGALGISNNMGGMVTNSLSSIEESESSVISTNLGAGKTDRAIQAFVVSLCMELIISSLGVMIISLDPVNDFIVGLFARNATTGVVDENFKNMISQIFYYEKMGIITLGINSAVLGLLYGFGYTKLSMALNIARVFAFRIPSLLVCEYALKMDYTAVGVAMGFSNIMIGLMAIATAIVMVVIIRKKEKMKEEDRMLSQEEKAKAEAAIKKYLGGFIHYKPNCSWDYEDGVCLKGAYEMYQATKDKFYLDFVLDHLHSAIDEQGNIATYDPEEKNIDNVQEATTLFLVSQMNHEERFDKALSKIDYQISIMPRTHAGSFWHKERYPYQIWLDGLYMGLPYCALRACYDHNSKMKKDVVNQFMNVEKYNWDPEKKVYLHCYDELKTMQWADKTTGRSPNVWLRSVGWLAMADCDVYETFHKNGCYLKANQIKPLLSKVLKSMEPYQDEESQCWYDLPLLKDEKGNYLETSGTLMFAYGYLKGARLGMLPFAEAKKGCRILKEVIGRFLDEQGLNHICKVSGLDNQKRDGSVAYYLSEPQCVNDPKGMGPFMMAYAEYLRTTK